MNDTCTITVAADGHIVNVDLSYLSQAQIDALDAKLPRDHIRRVPTACALPLTWLETFAAHIWIHLGTSLVISYQEQPWRVGITFYIAEGADAHQVKARIEDFITLPCYGIKVARPKRVNYVI